MGQGISVVCMDCGKKEAIGVGIGFGYPDIFQETLEDIKQGKYGKEWQKLCNSEEYVAVDAEYYFFCCNKCNYWKDDLGMDLFKPKNPEEIRKELYGIKTVEEWGYVPYLKHNQEERQYTLLKKYTHLCPTCKVEMKRMNHIPKDVTTRIRCKKCGGKFGPAMFMFWD